jgi:hypothetical protein
VFKIGMEMLIRQISHISWIKLIVWSTFYFQPI